MRGGRRFFLLGALVLVVGCGDSGTGPQEAEDVSFAASLGIDLAKMTRLPSGVYVQTFTVGTGTATVTASSRITADYKGSLANGNVFDAGRLTSLAVLNFIPGFTEGLIGMKKGEKRKIVIPSRLAYGDTPPAAIPKNAVLVFEVTLVEITG